MGNNFKAIFITIIFLEVIFIQNVVSVLPPNCQSNQYCCIACRDQTSYDAGQCGGQPSSDSRKYSDLTGNSCNAVNDPDCCGLFQTCWCCKHQCIGGQKRCVNEQAWEECVHDERDNDRCYEWSYTRWCSSNEYCSPTSPGCYPKKQNGGLCQHDYECLSGNCQNSVCCAAGYTCCLNDQQCPGSTQYYCQGSDLYKRYPKCTSSYTCDVAEEKVATCTGSDYVCDSNNVWRVRRDYYCQDGACSCQYRETNIENCDLKDGCYGNLYLDYYCSGGSCVYNTENPDDSQRACETCAGGKWLGESAPQKCCDNNDNFCYGNGVCTNGNFYDNHCGDGVCNCGETMSTCFNDCCKQDGQTCDGNNECCSGNCIADYEGNRYCCQVGQCAYNGTCYNNGQRLGNYTCYNGKWKRPPTTTISPDGTNNSWTRDDVQFTLTCNADTGLSCSSTYYKIINKNETCPSSGFTKATSGVVACPLNTKCEKVVCYFSVDNLNVPETVKRSKTFFIDKVPTRPPITRISYDTATPFSNEDIHFNLTCIPNELGCSKTYYKIINYDESCGVDGFIEGTSGTISCDSFCRKKVCFYSVDNGGNMEDINETIEFKIDKVKPECSINLPPLYQNLYSSPNLNISWTTDDVGLGVYSSSLIWSFDPLIPQEQWSNANSICNISDKNAVCSNLINEKTYYFRCKVRDNAGNINVSDYIAVTIDAIPPRTNFYSFENLTDQFILMWTAQDNIGISYFDIQVERNGSWANISTVCYNINVSCQNKICIGYANCSVSVSSYKWRIKAYDVVGNSGEWVYSSNIECEDKDNDGFCEETGDCDDTDSKVHPGAMEICDGKDNDCDGQIDEDFMTPDKKIGQPCGVGACEGIYVCSEDGSDVVCRITGGGGKEICDNNIDDDCDGVVDEEFEEVNGELVPACACIDGDKRPCGSDVGECKKGIQVCENGTWSECRGNVKPTEEICNDNKDNDCDGAVDEDYEIVNGEKVLGCRCIEGDERVCGSNIGICTTGTQKCINGVWSECEGNVKPTEEICNDGLDNDCDGETDEVECINLKCFNGLKDPEEEGIDCGEFCNKPCIEEEYIPNIFFVGFAVGIILCLVTGIYLVLR